MEHEAVASVGVIGVKSVMYDENVRAYVALTGGIAPRRTQALIQFARARVGYKAPEEIIFLDKMPLNATGKSTACR